MLSTPWVHGIEYYLIYTIPAHWSQDARLRQWQASDLPGAVSRGISLILDRSGGFWLHIPALYPRHLINIVWLHNPNGGYSLNKILHLYYYCSRSIHHWGRAVTQCIRVHLFWNKYLSLSSTASFSTSTLTPSSYPSGDVALTICSLDNGTYIYVIQGDASAKGDILGVFGACGKSIAYFLNGSVRWIFIIHFLDLFANLWTKTVEVE